MSTNDDEDDRKKPSFEGQVVFKGGAHDADREIPNVEDRTERSGNFDDEGRKKPNFEGQTVFTGGSDEDDADE